MFVIRFPIISLDTFTYSVSEIIVQVMLILNLHLFIHMFVCQVTMNTIVYLRRYFRVATLIVHQIHLYSEYILKLNRAHRPNFVLAK